jgi:hypothetical protein
MIEQLFKQAFVRRRMAANHLGIILDPFAVDLQQRGYAPSGIRHHVLVAEHFGQWLRQQQVSLRCLSTFHVDQFLRCHLPRCRCATPAPKRRFRCQAAVGRLVEFLRSQKKIRHLKTPTAPPGPTDQLLAAYDRHQDRVCGLAAETHAILNYLKRGRPPTRLVPLHPTAIGPMRAYAQRRQKLFPGAEYFFVSDSGGPLPYGRVQPMFIRLRAGLAFSQRPPRLHDLRHTMASTVLQRWLASPRGALNRVLILARYLGHRNLEATYWYLTARPQLLAEAAQRFDPSSP